MFEQILVYWKHYLGQDWNDWQIKLALSVVLWLLFSLLKRLLKNSVARRLKANPVARYNWNKGISYILNGLLLLSLAFLWANQFESFATFLGLLSAGLAIAFRDPIVNMAGWYYIVFRKPFKVGDRIQVGDKTGDVIDIKLFDFVMLELGNWVHSDQSTGRLLSIPNMRVFNTDIANYNATLDFIWNELELDITFDSNWVKAKEILTEILNQKAPTYYEQARENLRNMSGEYLIYYNKLTPIVYTSVEREGIRFSLRYLCPPKQRRGSAQQIWESILIAFAEAEDIDWAYPSQRIIGWPEKEK
ncbi:mechanosensitive ion channel [Saprospira sp. CCB-QB6]|uniref:mechanosensitive ion channel family protein n=1 Tax=Saprospira sp. CCB-QB6 TaxID=3023936 RepID=UPI00234A119E|nr:mechanosensitive ion channel domain-containing protein [Saprospira sp. CCB-QB6]WCL80282.1 mechanosensitive ion channel [Saprospira sp. CCB-QB6]